MIPFDDTGFKNAVDTVLKPWLRDHVEEGQIESFDGTKIQYYRAAHPDAKAVIVMLHGFCEFFGKFHETAYNFWEDGYTVYFVEHRGHGRSGRFIADPDVVEVKGFSEYVGDLKCFLDEVVLKETPGIRLFSDRRKSDEINSKENIDSGKSDKTDSGKRKNLILYAHSMGGCVGTLFLERYPEYFSSAVLTSPMLRMTFGETPLWKVKLLMLASKVRGWKEELMPGMQHFDPEKPDFEGSGSTSLARFLYQFGFRKDPLTRGFYSMNAGTWNWGRAAMEATQEAERDEERIRIPILLCQAGKDVYVDNEGQNEFAKKVRHVKLIRFPESEHEIYASDPKSLEKYYREILGFLRKASTL